MSSGFVSGGSLDKPTERDEEWLKAQRELEEERTRKAQLEQQQGGKSLFEILQANKAAKQEAFEEAAKLKNQFRSLDDDEVDFLDSVLESTRAREQAVKQETSEQLAAFRKHQEEVERMALLTATEDPALSHEALAVDEEEPWAAAGRKRKRGKEKAGFQGLKLKRVSSSSERHGLGDTEAQKEDKASATSGDLSKKGPESPVASRRLSSPESKPPASTGKGLLAGYSSDEDD